MSGVIGTQTLTQAGFIVRDVEKAKAARAEFLGVSVSPAADSKIAACERFGMTCVRRGKYGGGGEYAYLAADEKLKRLVELLENYSL
jgi:hypothetical protein